MASDPDDIDELAVPRVITVTEPWTDKAGRQWLVSGEFIDLDGRYELCGFAVRSFESVPRR